MVFPLFLKEKGGLAMFKSLAFLRIIDEPSISSRS